MAPVIWSQNLAAFVDTDARLAVSDAVVQQEHWDLIRQGELPPELTVEEWLDTCSLEDWSDDVFPVSQSSGDARTVPGTWERADA